jgi:hypothetical protein
MNVRGEIYGRWEERNARGKLEVFEGVQDAATAEHVATFRRKVEARPGFVRWLRPVLFSAAPAPL